MLRGAAAAQPLAAVIGGRRHGRRGQKKSHRGGCEAAATLQPRERTLTEADIEQASARIVADVAKKTGGALRG